MRAARVRGRLCALAFLAAGALVGAFACECVGLTTAIGRLTQATLQSNAVALRRPPTILTPMAMPAPPPAPPPAPSCMPSAIIRETDTRYIVDRRLIDLVLEDQAEMMRSVRVVPASVHGRTYPRLFGVRPDSLLGMLGFREGDYLESVNGFDLSTPERALEAYARLRSSDFLQARVRRGGQPVTLDYRVW